MKRRTFLKRSSIGLTGIAIAAGSEGLLAGDKGKRRVYGIPDSVRPRTPLEHNLVRYSLAHTDLPIEIWQDVVALGMLAKDVFDRPEVAAAFTRHPKGYLKTIGLEDVTLDPEALEVKVALAMGDPEVRSAIERDDTASFLQAIERRGLLRSPEPSQLASRLSAQLETMRAAAADGPSPEACTAFAICVTAIWIWVTVVQDVVVAATATILVNIYAFALIYVKVWGPPKPKPENLAAHPSFRIAAALGGQDFSDRAVQGFMEENVERIATAVESLQVYQDGGPLKGEELRGLVRHQLARNLGGHALSDELSQR